MVSNNNCININGTFYTTGDYVECGIRNIVGQSHTINDAKIFLANLDEIFICHNDDNFVGTESPDMLGYKFSWKVRIFQSIILGHYAYSHTDLTGLKKLEPKDIFDNILKLSFSL